MDGSHPHKMLCGINAIAKYYVIIMYVCRDWSHKYITFNYNSMLIMQILFTNEHFRGIHFLVFRVSIYTQAHSPGIIKISLLSKNNF